ncbi:MAG: peptide chain release factor N(5)-glutamine methyltransferase [Lewinellaceae bacterium]|jgi:release factor glutamine methyltransferase|nr:peptide chain release factor N(5)-glutamine methyltransferase [Lewinellaceae bacterium]
MNANEARLLLLESLTPRYGAGESASISRILLEDAFGIQPHERDIVLAPEDKENLAAMLQRLLEGEPVQYVLGTADFFGLRFKVSPAVLIPRQETEELVAWALEWLKTRQVESPGVLDIGLGSGCIGITLKKKNPGIRLAGVEKSPAALAIALENADTILGKGACHFVAGDILDESSWAQFSMYDMVISNPPYIPYSEQSLVPEHVIDYEPGLALFVEDRDPLVFYRAIAAFCLKKLHPGGALFFECNEFYAGQVADMLREKGFYGIILRNDLAGAARMVCAFQPF